MQSWKQCTLPVLITMAFLQPMHLGTRCIETYILYMHIYIYNAYIIYNIYIYILYNNTNLEL